MTVSRYSHAVRLRLASSADLPALHILIEASVRGLMTHQYSLAELEGALGTYLGVDTQLIDDQTYFIAEVQSTSCPTMVGCGGWSKRSTLFGADHRPGRENSLLDPTTDAAKIRAYFIHPDWTRRGIGRQILQACEASARAAGFKNLEMGATLTGVPMYRANGYAEVDSVKVALPNGEFLTVVRMRKAADQ